MTIPEYDQCDCGVRGPHEKCLDTRKRSAINIIYTLFVNGCNHIDSPDFSVIDSELRKVIVARPGVKCKIAFTHDLIEMCQGDQSCDLRGDNGECLSFSSRFCKHRYMA